MTIKSNKRIISRYGFKEVIFVSESNEKRIQENYTRSSELEKEINKNKKKKKDLESGSSNK